MSTDAEFICEIPEGAQVFTYQGEIIVVHPEHPVSRVNVAKKCLEPVTHE